MRIIRLLELVGVISGCIYEFLFRKLKYYLSLENVKVNIECRYEKSISKHCDSCI